MSLWRSLRHRWHVAPLVLVILLLPCCIVFGDPAPTPPDGLTCPSVETVSIPAGTFEMGRRNDGDDDEYGADEELPRHPVTLNAYQIGKYSITNQQFAAVLNWAMAKGRLTDSSGAAWTGSGDVHGNGYVLMLLWDSTCEIRFSNGTFAAKKRVGAPGKTSYSMDFHPVVNVTWFGAVEFCNWLSEWSGLTQYYDASTHQPVANASAATGYRLPTEAEWERAAAWDTSLQTPKHWIYGFTSDTLTAGGPVNCTFGERQAANPLGLLAVPYTSPVGWFNGTQVNPGGNTPTVNAVSPAGCYDCSGNVWNWCQDIYGPYSPEPATNPQGPKEGETRVIRGGSWRDRPRDCRTAARNHFLPFTKHPDIGFRVVKNVP